MYLSPGHPIIAIRNNRNQNGRRIGKKVNWQLIRVMTLFHYQDEIAFSKCFVILIFVLSSI